MKFKLQIK